MPKILHKKLVSGNRSSFHKSPSFSISKNLLLGGSTLDITLAMFVVLVALTVFVCIFRTLKDKVQVINALNLQFQDFLTKKDDQSQVFNTVKSRFKRILALVIWYSVVYVVYFYFTIAIYPQTPGQFPPQILYIINLSIMLYLASLDTFYLKLFDFRIDQMYYCCFSISQCLCNLC